MQAKSICICICSGIKVGLLYNNAGYICDVKCIESDSHSANYTSFMLNTINAMIFKSRFTVVSREAKKKPHACASSSPRDHYSELFTRMAALKF